MLTEQLQHCIDRKIEIPGIIKDFENVFPNVFGKRFGKVLFLREAGGKRLHKVFPQALLIDRKLVLPLILRMVKGDIGPFI